MARITSSKVLYQGRLFELRLDEVLLPSGRRVRREVVIHPGASAILPVIEPEKFLMIKQYRYAVGEEIYEIPAGTIERGESPLECARRELEEETGYKAENMKHMLTIYTAAGYSSERLHIFLAEKLVRSGSHPEIDEEISTIILSFEEALEWIRAGRIRDAKSIAAILYYLSFWRNVDNLSSQQSSPRSSKKSL